MEIIYKTKVNKKNSKEQDSNSLEKVGRQVSTHERIECQKISSSKSKESVTFLAHGVFELQD